MWAFLDTYIILINNLQNCKAFMIGSRLYLPPVIHTKRWLNEAAVTR